MSEHWQDIERGEFGETDVQMALVDLRDRLDSMDARAAATAPSAEEGPRADAGRESMERIRGLCVDAEKHGREELVRRLVAIQRIADIARFIPASKGRTPDQPDAERGECNVMEYDGAHKCFTHDRTWGAVPDPDEPCAPQGEPEPVATRWALHEGLGDDALTWNRSGFEQTVGKWVEVDGVAHLSVSPTVLRELVDQANRHPPAQGVPVEVVREVASALERMMGHAENAAMASTRQQEDETFARRALAALRPYLGGEG